MSIQPASRAVVVRRVAMSLMVTLAQGLTVASTQASESLAQQAGSESVRLQLQLGLNDAQREDLHVLLAQSAPLASEVGRARARATLAMILSPEQFAALDGPLAAQLRPASQTPRVDVLAGIAP